MAVRLPAFFTTLQASLQNCFKDGLVVDLILLRLCLCLFKIVSFSFNLRTPDSRRVRLSKQILFMLKILSHCSCSSLLTITSHSKHLDYNLLMVLLP